MLPRLIVLFIFSLCAAKIPIDQFFPFGEDVGDTAVPRSDDGGTPPINLTIAFPYFDYLHDALWVSVNGAISFVQVITTFTPSCVPVPQAFRMIAPYWADVDISITGAIWYRHDTDSAILNRVDTEIAQAFPGTVGVRMRWAFIVTWYNVTYYHDNCASCDRKRNSFQTVLATDGIQSYALFLYENVTWTTGDASGGVLGLGGTPAQAGFDAGDALNRLMIPGSCTADILTVNERSNVGAPGKWLFRVDSSDIQTAGCTDNFDGKLRFSPSFISSLQDFLQITGPCVPDDANVTCIFNEPGRNTTEVAGAALGNDSSARIVCETPFLYSVGRIDVGVRIESENGTNTFWGWIFVVDPEDLADDLTLVEHNDTDSSEFEITWDPAVFEENDTLVLEAIVIDNTPKAEWRVSEVANGIPNDGSFFFDNDTLLAIASALNLNVSDIATFYRLELVLRTSSEDNNTLQRDITIPPKVKRIVRKVLKFTQKLAMKLWDKALKAWNAAGELAGYVKPLLCEAWLAAQMLAPYPKPFDLIHCPPTVQQVVNDPRFEFALATTIQHEFEHKAYKGCFQTTSPSPSGYGQECCYDLYQGQLLVGPPDGGTIQRWSPHSQQGGWTGHIIQDMLPRYFCCSGNEVNDYLPDDFLCNNFYNNMGYDDGSQYEPWVPATAHGDPHITTFDNLGYTFNGAGEFWMLKNTSEQSVLLQARMEKFNDASIFTAFVMQSQNSPVVQIQKSQIRVIDVYISDVSLDLSQLRSVNLGSVLLNIADDRSEVKVTFPSGISFVFSTSSSAFGLMASADASNQGKTMGLLGTFDGNSTNDLMTPDGTIIPTNSTLQDIHYQFGLKWMLTAEESIFNYFNKTFGDYNFPDYVPNFNFNPDDASPDAVELCGDNWNCLYDYTTTGDTTIANQTLTLGDQYNETRTIAEQNISSCASLGIVDNGNCYSETLLPPALANCTCNSGFELVGDAIFACDEPDLTWNGTKPTCREVTTTTTTSTPATTSVATSTSSTTALRTGLPGASTAASQSASSTTSVTTPATSSTTTPSTSSTQPSPTLPTTTRQTTTTVTKAATSFFRVTFWLVVIVTVM